MGACRSGRRARRRGRGTRARAVAVSRGGRGGTDRESHAPWPCSKRAREPTSRLVRVTHRHAGSRDREAFGPCVSARASERRRVCQRRKSRGRTASEAGRGGSSGAPFAVSSARGPVPQSRLGIATSSPGNRRGRARVPHVRTSRGGSRARFDSPRTFWWLNRQWGKTERRGGEGRSDERSGDGTYGLRTAAKGQGRVSRRIASRGNPQKPRRGRFGDDEPEPVARGAANDEGCGFRGKPARASVKNSPSRRVSGRRERAHRGGFGRGKPREARLRRARECEAPTRPARRAKIPPRAAFARLRRGRERAAMAKPERREYCRTRAHLRKTAFQSRRVVPYPETTSLTPARPLRASISPSSARATDPRPCHRRR